jgi:hypothetical protein
VLGQLVEGLPGAVPAHLVQQLVDQLERPPGIRARMARPALGGRRLRRLDLFQAGVYEPQQRPQPPRLPRGQLGAVAVPAVHPGVQREAASPEHRDRAAVGVRQRRGDGQAQLVQALRRPVLAGDDRAVGRRAVHVELEEEPAPRGGEAIATVQQTLGDGLTGQRRAGVLVSAQQRVQRLAGGRRRRRTPDHQADARSLRQARYAI